MRQSSEVELGSLAGALRYGNQLVSPASSQLSVQQPCAPHAQPVALAGPAGGASVAETLFLGEALGAPLPLDAVASSWRLTNGLRSYMGRFPRWLGTTIAPRPSLRGVENAVAAAREGGRRPWDGQQAYSLTLGVQVVRARRYSVTGDRVETRTGR